jgi:hypothetical protein
MDASFILISSVLVGVVQKLVAVTKETGPSVDCKMFKEVSRLNEFN